MTDHVSARLMAGRWTVWKDDGSRPSTIDGPPSIWEPSSVYDVLCEMSTLLVIEFTPEYGGGTWVYIHESLVG